MRDPFNGLFKLPSKEERIAARAGAPLNPFKLMAMLTPMQAMMFMSGWLAWVMDAWDFFSVSLSVSRLATYFDREPASITTSITLTLLFRSLGAAVAGLASDRYGRRWPLVINLLLIAALSLSTAYVKTFSEFLAVRSLFGIAMGGIWGMSAATSLENMPAAPRGLFSGIFQQGYAFGYLIAASVNLTWVARTNNWRILFYLGAGLSLGAAIFRAILPESALFKKMQEERRANGSGGSSKAKVFWTETLQMLKKDWPRFVYGILLMTGFNFLSHSSQDLYPTMVEKVSLAALPDSKAKLLASKATIIGNCGAIAGGLIAGYLSQYLGRRLTIIMFVLFTAVLIPAWILPKSFGGLAAGAFFIQFGVQGAWGVVPIWLNELSPPAFRATFPGLAYQLGNMASSASSQIEATGGERNKIDNPRAGLPGQPAKINDYAFVSAVLLGVVCGYLILVVIFGKENRGISFEDAPLAVEQGASDVKPEKLAADPHHKISDERDIEHVGDDLGRADEKGSLGDSSSSKDGK